MMIYTYPTQGNFGNQVIKFQDLYTVPNLTYPLINTEETLASRKFKNGERVVAQSGTSYDGREGKVTNYSNGLYHVMIDGCSAMVQFYPQQLKAAECTTALLTQQLKEAEETVACINSKLAYLKAAKKDNVSDSEFRAWNALQILKNKKLNDVEQAELIAKLIDGTC